MLATAGFDTTFAATGLLVEGQTWLKRDRRRRRMATAMGKIPTSCGMVVVLNIGFCEMVEAALALRASNCGWA
jgi:hypothetical protein